jgi:hypothetical protein
MQAHGLWGMRCMGGGSVRPREEWSRIRPYPQSAARICRGRETGAALHNLTGDTKDVHNTYPWRVIGASLFLLIN